MHASYGGCMDLSDPISAAIPSVDGQVLQVLARAGLPLTGLTVAQLAGASPEGARRVLRRLHRHGLVTSRPAGAAILYEANRQHLLWPGIERLVRDADQAVSSIKEQIRTVVDDVWGAHRGDQVTAALFGSVARGEAGPDSDVDVLLIVPEGDDDAVETLVALVIDAVEAMTGNACHVYAATRPRFDELIRADDPMVGSWAADAQVFHGPDFRRRLRGATWDDA
ncbi:hypothetical protein GCM10023113_06600 [Cellulomonas oligotrophica]|uniref:Polymerase nucleotidyl transferase domain-containing protein n=2 Tax=Cellulomonas oligotrophica TaxID=931536 RepID=A0ABQ4D9H8_9CELL|nr:hypothetical protein Col01nite_15450 [Cellulomonas oligotrophica]